jgi:hypothetical protein
MTGTPPGKFEYKRKNHPGCPGPSSVPFLYNNTYHAYMEKTKSVSVSFHKMTSRSICQTDRVLNDLSYPSDRRRSSESRSQPETTGRWGSVADGMGGIPFCLFDICLKRGARREKKRTLSLSRQLLE